MCSIHTLWVTWFVKRVRKVVTGNITDVTIKGSPRCGSTKSTRASARQTEYQQVLQNDQANLVPRS